MKSLISGVKTRMENSIKLGQSLQICFFKYAQACFEQISEKNQSVTKS